MIVRVTRECIEAAEGRAPRTRTIRVFENRFLEDVLARAHPAFPAAFYGPVALFAIAFGAHRLGVGKGVVWVVAGWLAFSLLEYVLHRFVFHRAFPDTPVGRLEAFLVHGYHHAYPRDAERLVMPPMISVPFALFFLAAWVIGFGWSAGLAGFGGTVLGYVAYDETHYLLHHVRPRTRLGRMLRRHHLVHHHAVPPARFGVSSPLWDVVFRTMK